MKGRGFCFILVVGINGFRQIKIEKSKRDFSLTFPPFLTASGPEKVGSKY